MSMTEEVKKGKVVVIASKDTLGKIQPKSSEDAKRVVVVKVD